MAAAEARETVAYPPAGRGSRSPSRWTCRTRCRPRWCRGRLPARPRFLVNGQVVGETYLVWSSSANRDVVDQKGLGDLWDFLQGEEAPTFAQALELLEP